MDEEKEVLQGERLVKLPPSCTWCEHFRYKKGAEKMYRCKQSCKMSNDIFELFEDCYRIDLMYGVIDVGERTD